jgi:asparagine synthase (glutamine-hydrolysing)
MPGIAGIVSTTDKRLNERDLDLMINCMMHESFYTSGRYVNDHIGLYVGWACHKGSFADCMPIWNEKKDLCLFFSGEDFTGRDFIENLKFRGHKPDPSNASYLIHIYEEKGDDFFSHLNGRFSGVLLDLLNKKVILFNDRYGMQRIYYHESKDVFIFSSEAKSLIKVIPELGNLDYKGLGEFFSCGCVLEDRTLFEKIFLLPCGSMWIFREGSIADKGCYFKASNWEEKPALDTDLYYKRLKDTFEHIPPRYFRPQEKIGMSLTGGLDTRMILAYLNPKPAQLPCYTFGGVYRDSADVKIAREIATLCNQPFKVIRLEKDFLSNFPKLAERTVYITDGSMDVSGSPDLYANKLARDIAPIRMTGNYGSEVLRSNIAFKPNPPCEQLFNEDFYKHIQEASTTFTEIRRGHPLSFVVAKQAPWHHYGRLSVEQSQLTVRSPFLDNDLVGMVYQAPPESRTGSDISLRLIRDGNSSLAELVTDRGFGGDSNYFFPSSKRLIQDLLFKAEYAYDYGMPQWLARLDSIFQSWHLERLFLGRHKFYHFRIWYKNELSCYVREILLDRRTANRSYWNSDFIIKMVEGHLKGECNYTTEIHKIITMELIHRLFIDR